MRAKCTPCAAEHKRSQVTSRYGCCCKAEHELHPNLGPFSSIMMDMLHSAKAAHMPAHDHHRCPTGCHYQGDKQRANCCVLAGCFTEAHADGHAPRAAARAHCITLGQTSVTRRTGFDAISVAITRYGLRLPNRLADHPGEPAAGALCARDAGPFPGCARHDLQLQHAW